MLHFDLIISGKTRIQFSLQVFSTSKCNLPGDVIVHAVSCLLVMDPVADENAGGLFGQLTGAQHAITVPLPVTEAALVHLATGIPEYST